MEFTDGHTGRLTINETEDVYDNYAIYSGKDYANYERPNLAPICKIGGEHLDIYSEMRGLTLCDWHHESKESSEEDWGAYSDD